MSIDIGDRTNFFLKDLRELVIKWENLCCEISRNPYYDTGLYSGISECAFELEKLLDDYKITEAYK